MHTKTINHLKINLGGNEKPLNRQLSKINA